jgi:predicted nicotinamide N-methyase
MFTLMVSPSRPALPSTSERFPTALSAPQLDPQNLLALIASRYDVKTEQITFGGQTLSLIAVRDTNKLLDAIDPATFAEDERLPYWADLWPSSVELARSCLQDLRLEGLRVLELGCGLGLAGIAAALAGAEVTLTDYEDDALLFSRWNALTNLDPPVFRSRVALRRLDWRKPQGSEQYDVVIGSDIVYERRNVVPLLQLLDNVLAPDGYALLTDPGRQTGREFIGEAARHGFTVETTQTEVRWHNRRQLIISCKLRLPGGES